MTVPNKFISFLKQYITSFISIFLLLILAIDDNLPNFLKHYELHQLNEKIDVMKNNILRIT